MIAALTPTRAVLRGGTCALLVLSMLGGVAWAFWTTESTPGSSGASAVAHVNQGSTPSVTVSGRAVTIDWAATTLSTGDPVSGYLIRRYDANTLAPQQVGSDCGATVTATRCTETQVRAGQWVYSVTPVVGTNWRGEESVKSGPVTVAGPSLGLSTTRVRPGTSMTGTASGFLPGETLRYRLDSPAGTELTGTLAGNPTPAVIPAGGGGGVSVTVPAGTSDGDHTVHAVASPSGDAATAAIIVDGTAPPAPALTLTPTATSGDTVTFAYTKAEASATVECRLDTAAFAACESPIEYSGLVDGSHTFQARAIDTVGNVSTVTSYTWTVNTTVPTVTIGFPQMSAAYNDTSFTAGCGTTGTADLCGAADDDTLVTVVNVSLRRLDTGLFWTGSSFSAAAETWLTATGTTNWTYGVAAAALPEGDYTLRARVSDGSNLGFDSRTFTVDRTAPPVPTLTSVPPDPSGPTATVEFATTDPTARFECRLDAGTWNACSSPKRYADLIDGTHTVAVRAVDGAGNTSAGTSATWTVDGIAPTAAIAFPTAGSFNLTGWAAGCGTPATGDICGTADDVGGGTVAISIRRASTNSYWQGSAFTASSETWLSVTGTSSWSYPFAGTDFPADGSYTVRWRAVDAAGNTTTGDVHLTIDTAAPPSPQIVQAPPDPSGSSVQFDFTVAEPRSSTECRMDAGGWTPCTAPTGFSDLSGGTHTFAVRATDAPGNTSETAVHTWTVDTDLPSISIDHPDGGRAFNDASYTAGCGTPSAGDLCGTAADPQGNLASVEVSLRRQSTSLYWDGTGFSSATEVFLPATGTDSWSYPLAPSAFPDEGQYTGRARAVDSAGQTATDSVSFTIDRTAPEAPTITSGPTGTTEGDGTFSFTGEAGAAFQCRLDAGAWQTCSSPQRLGGLADGSHTFDLRATDHAGNTSVASSRTWTVDATAPTATTTFPSSGGAYNNTTYDAGCATVTGDICGTATDSGAGVAKVETSLERASTGLYLSGTTFSSSTQDWMTATGTTAWSYPVAATTFPANDTYTLAVRITDGVGNTSTTTTTFHIDRTKPIAVGYTTTNAQVAGRLDPGDTFTITFSKAISPSSIIAGWNGATAQNIVVRGSGNGNAKDRLTVYNATNTALLPLGMINLKRPDYIPQTMTFGGTGNPSTLTTTGNSLTVTLGTPSRVTGVAALASNSTWTPDPGATDPAGNSASTTAWTENDNDPDF